MLEEEVVSAVGGVGGGEDGSGYEGDGRGVCEHVAESGCHGEEGAEAERAGGEQATGMEDECQKVLRSAQWGLAAT